MIEVRPATDLADPAIRPGEARMKQPIVVDIHIAVAVHVRAGYGEHEDRSRVTPPRIIPGGAYEQIAIAQRD